VVYYTRREWPGGMAALNQSGRELGISQQSWHSYVAIHRTGWCLNSLLRHEHILLLEALSLEGLYNDRSNDVQFVVLLLHCQA
jgi:hypothetical protein